MISYEWRPKLSDDDLDAVLELVAAATDYDEEAGFSHIDPEIVPVADDGSGTVRHLAIKARRDLGPQEDGPMVVVAYLHLFVDDEGLGTVSYAVHPDYRSRGITTLLVEEIGLDVGGVRGWDGSGATALRCWAYSTHPASERLTKRFDVPAVSRQWTVVRHLTGPFALPIDRPEIPDGLVVGEPRELAGGDAAVVDILGRAALPDAQRDRLESDVGRGGGQVIEARDDAGRIVGFVWYSTDQRIHLELRAAPIHAVVLDPGARGRGLGGVLLVAAMERQKDAGVQVSMLRIDPDDASAVRMCRLLGFEQEDAHSCYQVGETSDPPPAFA
ncbi:GNAT family N-acetyltransferase [Gordonia tangerina]|uniref:GNAT family N-acetyltransferase n=1 Tax=Gordonia tangerina TaxID=2911060 RepID=A0ABS9DK89_9ACTN|nr:GNAT family N-acetyltransferase [Gordonia tangerina]MCF3939642.1 GNAT family N-acetyltransferase [Gordonia tangerina]